MKRIPLSSLLRYLLPLCLLGLCCLKGQAQQFSVRSFRPLPNDITAYIDPVRDLNEEACALLKVVGEADFVFSTPLGVVRRRNEVGEIWLYLPRGTRQLTIKHPRWGVLRDYRFASPLESRMTYELVLAIPSVAVTTGLPPMHNRPIGPDTTRHQPQRLTPYPTPRPKRPRERMHYLLLANLGAGTYGPSLGVRAGIMRRHGTYLLLQSDLRSLPATQGDCDRNGIPTDAQGAPYYTGETAQGRRMALAGGIHRLFNEFCLYEGIGYGERTVGWETTEKSWLRNADFSAQGLSAEIGGIWRCRRVAFSAGVLTIAGKYWEGTVGIGLHF